MNVKNYAVIAIVAFAVIVGLAVGVTARFSLSNITADPYTFIEDFFSQWSLALSAAGTVILALSVFSIIYENRRREQREKQQAIHALHDEIHWNMTHIITLRFGISEWLRYMKKHPMVPNQHESPFELIDTRVFDDMRSRGQLYWLEDIRMDVISCYATIRDYNMDRCFKLYHLEILAKLHEWLGKAIRDLEAKFDFLPHYVKDKNKAQQEKQQTES